MLRPVRELPCVLLLSGGLDSAANLAFCDLDKKPVLALTIDYGQRAAKRELEAARKLCAYYGAAHQVVELPWLGTLGGSSLTDGTKAVPELKAGELDALSVTKETAHAVWVPNRNGVLIHVAAAIAESRGIQEVLVGFNREEASTFPDNSQEYAEAVNRALAFSTQNKVRVCSYTVEWDKAQMVSELRKLPRAFPFEMLWSCYQGGEKPCGKCESCQRLERGQKTL